VDAEDARLARVTQICLSLPETARLYSGQHARFLVRKKTFTYYVDNHHGDGIVAINVKAPAGDNVKLVEANPDRFYIPAYVGPQGWVGLRLDTADVDWNEVHRLIVASYRLIAPNTLAAKAELLSRSASAPVQWKPLIVKAKAKAAVPFDTVRRLALPLPGVEESTSYGTPALKVKGKLFARLHDNSDWLVVRIDPDERTMRMKVDPEVYFITDHYANHPWMLVRLSVVPEEELCELLQDGWRLVAPKRLVAEFDKT
jgi:hypothetical protein